MNLFPIHDSSHRFFDPPPCSFDPQVLPNLVLEKQLAKKEGQSSCHLIAGGKEDWDKVEPLYNREKVKGCDIAKIEVIVNKTFSMGFLSMLDSLEQRSQQEAFKPSWPNEASCDAEKQMRQEVDADLHTRSQAPMPFRFVKVTPMFHGTKKDLLPYIFTGNLAALSTTDVGFFGKGVYHSSFASYAYKYAEMEASRKGALLLNWVCFSSAYPVIHHPEYGDVWDNLSDKKQRKKHWKHLIGKRGEKYDAHYALVAPENRLNPFEMNFYPPKKGKNLCTMNL